MNNMLPNLNYSMGDDTINEYEDDLDVSWQEEVEIPSKKDAEEYVMQEIIVKPQTSEVYHDKKRAESTEDQNLNCLHPSQSCRSKFLKFDFANKSPIAPKPSSDSITHHTVGTAKSRNSSVSSSEDCFESSPILSNHQSPFITEREKTFGEFPAYTHEQVNNFTTRQNSKRVSYVFEDNFEVSHSTSLKDQLMTALQTIKELRSLLTASRHMIANQDNEIKSYRKKLGLEDKFKASEIDQRSYEEVLSELQIDRMKHTMELKKLKHQIELIRVCQSKSTSEIQSIRKVVMNNPSSQFSIQEMEEDVFDHLDKSTIWNSDQVTTSESGISSQITDYMNRSKDDFKPRIKLNSDSSTINKSIKIDSESDALLRKALKPTLDEKSEMTKLEYSDKNDLLSAMKTVISDRRKWEYYACRLVRDMVERDQFFLTSKSPSIFEVNDFKTLNERKWANFAYYLMDILLTIAPERAAQIDRELLDSKLHACQSHLRKKQGTV